MRIYLNKEWLFSDNFNNDMLSFEYDTSNMKKVSLPHSVVETPFNYFDEGIYQMVSCYRKIINVSKYKDKCILLTIEAAAHESILYVNGKEVIKHCCGYTSYTVDISSYLDFDKDNIIVIKVDSNESINVPPFGNVIDYMTYGGIYREVFLDVKNKSYISDVFPKVSINDDNIVLACEVKCVNNEGTSIRQELYDLDNNLICKFKENELIHKVSNVKLWDIDNPNLYYLKTILYNDSILDERIDRIGFRCVEFRSDGFYLNNKKIKLRGLNRHQSYPYVGYAMPKSIQRDDAYILKYKLGLNLVRTSHYPQSHHFIDACDEIGLLVFTEIPGWQHIGDDEWKKQAIKNTSDMVLQYRNHPSIILWGVRINESLDDDELYEKTNDVAHKLDLTRQTAGVRYLKKSSLLEDVYTFNDFSHNGPNDGVLDKSKVTSDINKGYLVTEYNGHMFPTKNFDSEEHRVEHMRRHANVVDGYYGKNNIAGGIGWCMADYNTHKDFGSGDRICYHGVLDMFRNPKLAAYVYSSQSEYDDVLEVSSMMNIGEHPAHLAKDVYVLTNASSVKLYKNDIFIKEYDKSIYKNMPHGPILIDDFVGSLLEKEEGFSYKKALDIKKILMAVNKYGLDNLTFKIKMLVLKCMVFRGVKMEDAVRLYNKYVGNFGCDDTVYKFEAIKDGKVVKTLVRKAVKNVKFDITTSSDVLIEENTYDVIAIRIRAVDEFNSTLPYYQDSLYIKTEGPIEIIGPKMITLRGGMAGTYIKSSHKTGVGRVYIGNEYEEKMLEFKINIR